MTSPTVEQAARNNALWCDAISAIHSGRGEFQETLWLNRFGAPRYYPDAVTLTGVASASAQAHAIDRLVGARPRSMIAVKDSFRCLDLGGLGFAPLFDAEWIGMELSVAAVRRDAEAPRWRQVVADSDLLDWERRWAASNVEVGPERLFTPALLSEPDIAFVLVLAHDAPIGGGIFNRGDGAVGISNLFASSVDVDFVWRGLLEAIAAVFPGLPLVGYDRGQGLAAAHRVGFATIGPLRIWSRPATSNPIARSRQSMSR